MTYHSNAARIGSVLCSVRFMAEQARNGEPLRLLGVSASSLALAVETLRPNWMVRDAYTYDRKTRTGYRTLTLEYRGRVILSAVGAHVSPSALVQQNPEFWLDLLHNVKPALAAEYERDHIWRCEHP